MSIHRSRSRTGGAPDAGSGTPTRSRCPVRDTIDSLADLRLSTADGFACPLLACWQSGGAALHCTWCMSMHSLTSGVLRGAAGWVLAEMRAAEADKTEGELAGVVRRLKLDQQGTQLDCAICLRRVRAAALTSEHPLREGHLPSAHACIGGVLGMAARHSQKWQQPIGRCDRS